MKITTKTLLNGNKLAIIFLIFLAPNLAFGVESAEGVLRYTMGFYLECLLLKPLVYGYFGL